MNVVILRGHLSSAPSTRTLPSGDTLVTFEVTTRPLEGPAQSVPVAWPDAPRRAATLPPGAEVVVTGRVRRRFFKAGTMTASRTEVLADAVLPVRQALRVQAAARRTLEQVQPLLADP
jgi:single-strand DNA-binding protein